MTRLLSFFFCFLAFFVLFFVAFFLFLFSCFLFPSSISFSKFSFVFVRVCWHGFPQQTVFKLGTHHLFSLCDFICANKQHARMCRWDMLWLHARTHTHKCTSNLRVDAAIILNLNIFLLRRWTVPLSFTPPPAFIIQPAFNAGPIWWLLKGLSMAEL